MTLAALLVASVGALVGRLVGAVAGAVREQRERGRRLRRTRLVAAYWRDAIMAWNDVPAARWAAHPLAMVLSALEGEENPAEVGLPTELHEHYRRALVPEPREDDAWA